MRSVFFILLFLLISVTGFSQQTDTTNANEVDEGIIVKPDNSDPFKIGIKIGAGYSGMLGTELQNSVGRVGVDGSIYLRYRFKSKFTLIGELGASFRGSSFNNGDTGYSSIRMYYLDIPVYGAFPISKNKTTFILAGFQYSHLLNANMYVGRNGLPNPSSPALKTFDVLPLAGIQFNTDWVNIQLMLKYGLVNLNQNQPWPTSIQGGSPTLPSNTGGSIHNFAFEFNLFF